MNLLGMKADYLVWNKLPFREPNERIAKYGQGFSKILGMMKVHDNNQTNISQSLEPGKFAQTYQDNFHNTPQNMNVNHSPVQGREMSNNFRNQYPNLPHLSPRQNSMLNHQHTGSMDHISGEVTQDTDPSRSPTKGAVSITSPRVGITMTTFSPKKSSRQEHGAAAG